MKQQNASGKYNIAERNDYGEKLLDLCGEQELVKGNTYFRKKLINKYRQERVNGGDVVDRGLFNCIIGQRNE